MPTSDEELLALAAGYQERAWAPVSNYKVGAAVLTGDGRVFGGCNVENILLALSCCAERVAVHTAIAEGARSIPVVAVVTPSSPPASPCGLCRQLLVGWGTERVILSNPQGERVELRFADLLPYAFKLEGPVAP